jgi:serine/threonine protein kinase
VSLSGALAALHRSGIVCRSLHASNVIISPTGDVSLVDYGIRGISADRDDRPNTIANLVWLGPEGIAAGRAVESFAMDVWRLGLIVYSVFTGGPPFIEEHCVATMKRILGRDLRIPEGIDQTTRAVIEGALATNPEDRLSAEAIYSLFVESDGGATARTLSGRRESAAASQERPVMTYPHLKVAGVRVRGRTKVTDTVRDRAN